jgi:hypothetical protein
VCSSDLLNFVDEKDEVQARGIPLVMALVSAYSDYQKVGDAYRQYIDDNSKAKLGKYVINLYYNADSGDISHITFTLRANQSN